ncbi:MAG TPA: DUF2157 domain-containing protein [Candidatus Moranbacteria bacterium]|nr:DUF2157 domain-containing protein [Candidatus Moranbacteria bacterium]
MKKQAEQRAIDYLRQYKDQFDQEELKGQLLKAGYEEDVVGQALKVAYEETKLEEPPVVPPSVSEEKEPDKNQSRVVAIVLTIGALFIGLGFFSFLATNWEKIGDALKLILFLGSMIGAYALGWYLKEVKNYARTGVSLFFLGTLLYGANLFLIGQIFHIPVYWMDGFLLWMLGVLAISFIFESRIFYYLALLLGFVSLPGYFYYFILGIVSSDLSPSSAPLVNDSYIAISVILSIISAASVFWIGLVLRKKVSSGAEDLVGEGKSEVSSSGDWTGFGWIVFASVLIPIFGWLYLLFNFISRKKISPKEKEFYFMSELFFMLTIAFVGVFILLSGYVLGIGYIGGGALFIAMLIGFLIAYYFDSITTLFMAMFLVMSWWMFKASFWLDEAGVHEFAKFIGLWLIGSLGYIFARLVMRKKEFFSKALFIFSVPIIIFYILVLSTESGVMAIESLMEGDSIFNSWKLMIVLTGLLFAVVGLSVYSLSKKLIVLVEVALLIVFSFLLFFLGLLPELEFFKSNYDSVTASYKAGLSLSAAGIAFLVLTNIILFSIFLGAVFIGYKQKNQTLVNIGLSLIFVFAVIKYFNFFFSFLDKSIFFTTAGILFMVFGWAMEVGRRKILNEIKQ